MTNQFNITNYIKDYESTSLSFEQKTLASTDFKSCITASFITPSLPLLIRWTESSITSFFYFKIHTISLQLLFGSFPFTLLNEGTKENEVTGNWVSVMHIMGCDMLALIKNVRC